MMRMSKLRNSSPAPQAAAPSAAGRRSLINWSDAFLASTKEPSTWNHDPGRRHAGRACSEVSAFRFQFRGAPLNLGPCAISSTRQTQDFRGHRLVAASLLTRRLWRSATRAVSLNDQDDRHRCDASLRRVLPGMACSTGDQGRRRRSTGHQAMVQPALGAPGSFSSNASA